MNTVSGLPWTVLRVHRPALVLWGAFVAVVAGLLVWAVEIEADRARAELARCAHHDACSVTATLFYGDTIRWASLALCFSFCAVAAWAGASLVARELESGTAQLAWTQSVSPVRWLTAKLAVPALALTLGGAVLVPLFRWVWSNNPDRLDDGWSGFSTFVALGPATVAYALCALAVGALAGLLLGRALPALGVTLAVMLLLNQILGTFRADLWPKVTRTGVTAAASPTGPGSWRTGCSSTATGSRTPTTGTASVRPRGSDAARPTTGSPATTRSTIRSPTSGPSTWWRPASSSPSPPRPPPPPSGCCAAAPRRPRPGAAGRGRNQPLRPVPYALHGGGDVRGPRTSGRPGAAPRYPARHVAVTIDSDELATLSQ
ncbi:hypothetical protein ACFQ51_19945 [Streptomyces kaempferi]